jgi:hypothetical protein
MRSVLVHLSDRQITTRMNDMRLWLDSRRFEPSIFTCEATEHGFVARIGFKLDAEAEAFAREFEGRVSSSGA